MGLEPKELYAMKRALLDREAELAANRFQLTERKKAAIIIFKTNRFTLRLHYVF